MSSAMDFLINLHILNLLFQEGEEEPVWGCGSFEDIMDWASETYTIPTIISVFKKKDINGNIISCNCPGCN